MGPSSALATVRKALSMGPDAAVHIHDDALHGSCAPDTAKVSRRPSGRSSRTSSCAARVGTDARPPSSPAPWPVPRLAGADRAGARGGRLHRPRPPWSRERLRRGRGRRPGRGRRVGRRRAPLPGRQGRHGRQVRAGDRLHPWPTWVSTTRARSAPPAPPPRSSTSPPALGEQQVEDPGWGRRFHEAGRVPGRPRVHLSTIGSVTRCTGEFLVLVEHEDGAAKKVTYEMLTKARDLGDPVAVFVSKGLDGAREGLGRYGAARRRGLRRGRRQPAGRAAHRRARGGRRPGRAGRGPGRSPPIAED